jgi:RHS repeat-associated protein
MIAVSDPLGDTTNLTYNSAGQPTTLTDPLGNQTQFGYESGIVASVTDALGRTKIQSADSAGRVSSVTDPLNHTIRVVYDPLDEVTASIDALGNQTLFTYDSNGNLVSVTDANQHTTTYTYDSMDRPATRTDPLGNQSSTQHDMEGNLTQATDRKGQATTMQYDGLNRLTLLTFADGSTVASGYDAGNRLTGVTDSLTGAISRTYDGLDRMLSETTPQGSVAYTYDADERRQTMTVSGQAPVSYTFDNASRLTSIAQGSSGVSFAFDSGARRTSMTLPNGIVANYGYDAASQLLAIVYQSGALGTADLQYSYDLAGRRVGVAGSLATEQLPAAVSNAAYNANNQLTQWGSTTMTYDLNGNTLNDGLNMYVWDARDRLTSADGNGASFTYDPLGRRMGKTILSATTDFLYDGPNPVQEQNGTVVTANLLTGDTDERFQRTDLTGAYNYLTDALGSTVALTDSAGAEQTTYSYGPYGALSINGTTTNSYEYTGREDDSLGIYYYRARYYNPATGRFISEDPLGLAGGINQYVYAYNNPISSIDPFGTDSTGSTALDNFFDFVGGAWSTATFGASDYINGKLGFQNLYNKCNGWYKAGELAGAAAPAALGAEEGLAQDLAKTAGDEWSHWIPARAAQSRGGWIPDFIVESNLNGQYASVEEHALSDPSRYQFMNRAWKNANPMPPAWQQQLNRIPSWVLGAGAGAAYGGASLAGRSCGCN